MVFYNKESKGRDKSLTERVSVKNACAKLIDKAGKNNQVLASAEFLYSVNYYLAYYNSSKKIGIQVYADIAQKKLTKSQLEHKVVEFLTANIKSGNDIWFMGRDDEYYFQCLKCFDLEQILNKYNCKYTLERFKNVSF